MSLHTTAQNLCMDTCLSVDAPAVLIFLPAIQLWLYGQFIFVPTQVPFIFHFHLSLQAVYWRKPIAPRISIMSWQFEVTESSKQFWVQATCGAPTQSSTHWTQKFSHLKCNRIVKKKSLPHFFYILYKVLQPVLLIPLILFCWRYSYYNRMTMKKTVQPIHISY